MWWSLRFRGPIRYCPQCGGWGVRVMDWLPDKEDKEKWQKVRLKALKRDNWRCQSCGRSLVERSAHVHHLSYDNYFNLDNLISLCPRCHQLAEGKTTSYEVGKVLAPLGGLPILGVLLSWLSSGVKFSHNAVFALLIGMGLLIHGLWLIRETLRVRASIERAVENPPKSQGDTSVNEEEIFSRLERVVERLEKDASVEDEEILPDLEIPPFEEKFYCQICGRKISEKEFEEFGGLCRRCRGMPLQRGFSVLPGFPGL